MRKILIIKTGFTETLEKNSSKCVCYGDILRSTVLLNIIGNAEITWLTDISAVPLLEDNPNISHALGDSSSSRESIAAAKYDEIINLEKDVSTCRFADSLYAAQRKGFGYDPASGRIRAYPGTEAALGISADYARKRENRLAYQAHLADIAGRTWSGERYSFFCKSDGTNRYDIGFNWTVGSRWDNKAWPKEFWKQLENMLLKDSYSITWQKDFNDLRKYIRWINSCNMIITNDSLGLHIALALGKKTIAMFGPTSYREVCDYGLMEVLLPEEVYDCMPCFTTSCDDDSGHDCISKISPMTAYNAVRRLFSMQSAAT